MKKSFLIIPALLISGGLTACSSLFDNPTIPEGSQSPNTYHSRAGGLNMARYAEALFIEQIGSSIVDGGLVGDELVSNNTQGSSAELDHRYMPEGGDVSFESGSYSFLQRLRGQSSMARAILERFASDMSPSVRGRLQIMDAYARILLADQYCSGVPLSILEFDGDYTLAPSSTLKETYESALPLFDSAIALSGDSTQLVLLAKLGKARALLGAGRLAEANAIASGIATVEAYTLKGTFFSVGGINNRLAKRGTISDSEGGNGLPYISSGDPRTKVVVYNMALTSGGSATIVPVNYPEKYARADSFIFTLASGIDARLIEAEFQLKDGNNSWLAILNDLRTNGTILRIDSVSETRSDTVWAAGSGGVAGLKPLVDPGTADSRVDLLFAERAYWQFMTGNRLPDMRRLVRDYARDRETVFPSGSYEHGVTAVGGYGTDINIPIPRSETKNRLFKGCLNRDE